MNDCQKGRCFLCIPGCNTAPLLEMQKGIFHQVTDFIDVPVICPHGFSILFGRYDRLHACLSRCLNDLIGIIASISNQFFGFNAVNQVAGFGAVGSIAGANKHFPCASTARCIFVFRAPFCKAYGFVAAFGACCMGMNFTWLASIINHSKSASSMSALNSSSQMPLSLQRL